MQAFPQIKPSWDGSRPGAPLPSTVKIMTIMIQEASTEVVATETEGWVEQYSGQVHYFCGKAKGDSSRGDVYTDNGPWGRQQRGS